MELHHMVSVLLPGPEADPAVSVTHHPLAEVAYGDMSPQVHRKASPRFAEWTFAKRYKLAADMHVANVDLQHPAHGRAEPTELALGHVFVSLFHVVYVLPHGGKELSTVLVSQDLSPNVSHSSVSLYHEWTPVFVFAQSAFRVSPAGMSDCTFTTFTMMVGQVPGKLPLELSRICAKLTNKSVTAISF